MVRRKESLLLIIILIILINPVTLENIRKTTPSLDISNGFAFYFSTETRNLRQHTYVTRAFDLKVFFHSSQAIRQAGLDIQLYCTRALADMEAARVKESLQKNAPANEEPMFLWVHRGLNFDKKEAEAKCRDAGRMLPEIMTAAEKGALMNFMAVNQIPHIFAGIEQYFPDMTKRFRLMESGFQTIVSTNIMMIGFLFLCTLLLAEFISKLH
jgi:hypothetical protein